MEFQFSMTVCATVSSTSICDPVVTCAAERKRRAVNTDLPNNATATTDLKVTLQVGTGGANIKITTDEDEDKTEQAANNQFCMSSGQTIGLGLLVLVLLIVSCAVLIIGIVLMRRRNNAAAGKGVTYENQSYQ